MDPLGEAIKRDAATQFLRDLDDANKTHATEYMAVQIALLDKGLLTEKDLNRARIQAQHIVSQEYARKRDAAPKPGDDECT